jgi:Fe-S cluster biogenesis protein NfuA
MPEDIEKQILTVINKVRPFLQRDGGDIDFIGFRDGIVYVQMAGACEGCAMAGEDISSGVEIILMEEVPGVIAVKNTEIPDDLMKAYEERKLAEYKRHEEEYFAKLNAKK